ncbi:MAG: SGNH/GDSL hydrolase family protein, partial [Lachnospiraceae bacterium]|nr:SGNH/GDSL hydrolase family protein [Lachnospiraceae bacterium]
ENSETVRNMINSWMRTEESGFDGVIEFGEALADPDDPKCILEKYTHSDGLHPYDGYEAMANVIDLKMLE